MRLGLLISCDESDSDKLIKLIDELCNMNDSKLHFIMKTNNRIRIVEKKEEEI